MPLVTITHRKLQGDFETIMSKFSNSHDSTFSVDGTVFNSLKAGDIVSVKIPIRGNNHVYDASGSYKVVSIINGLTNFEQISGSILK